MAARSWATNAKALLSLLSSFLAVLAIFPGCASMQDTPQQQYVWAMGRICDAKSNQFRPGSQPPLLRLHEGAV
jgi:hypothetical protein